MKTVKAEYAGACYGVKRALDMAEETLRKVDRAYTLGPLIHNPQVVEDLEQRGAEVADDIESVGDATVIIRSHGVMPDAYRELLRSGAELVDATCPHVSRAQKAAAELGRSGKHVIVVGEAGHPEVMGLCAYAREVGAPVTVVQDAGDIPDGIEGPVGVVVQTTQTREALESVVEELRRRGISPEVKNTICSATSQRQRTAAELASRSDAMVVIGGRNSSNTTRLYEICRRYCDRAYHIESADELTPGMFIGCSCVGVSAGASTPEDQIQDVIDVIEGFPESIEGAKVASVAEGSPAYDAGFETGCVITSINGDPLTDILCWRWGSADDIMELGYIDLDGDRGSVELVRGYGEDWGLELEGAVYDGVRTCKNACTFCFMRQLPPDMRPSLSLRDDDFRLSFLTGTFSTFTNLSSAEERRIIEQRISPLRVSLHALDSAVRERLMGKHAKHGLDALCRLLDAGIEFDAQIVLVPGENDGSVLLETLEWAYERPGILNIGVVPLGFTRYQSTFQKSFDDPDDARRVLAALEPFQKRAVRERGRAWVYAADEFYVNAYGADVLGELPPADFYGDSDMYEDGIGIIRSCADELYLASETGLVSRAQSALETSGMSAVYIAGEAMRPYFGRLLESCGLAGSRPLIIENAFFGGNVNVTGLLCGCDICKAIKEDGKREKARGARCIYLIPSVVFNADGLTLDDMTIDDIRRETAEEAHICASNPLDYLQQIIEIANGEVV